MAGKSKIHATAVTLGLACAAPAFAQTSVSTAFTYQGQLTQAGLPASGTFDLRFQLFASAVGGAAVGTDCVDGVIPNDGLFTVELDFGATPFNGSARWVEIAVRSDATPANCASGGVYTVLATRQALTAAPYALGVRLPLAETSSTNATLFDLTSSGTNADCGRFNITNAANQGEAVEGNTAGSGTAVQGITTGTGRAAYFQCTNAANNLSTLRVDTNSTNAAVAAIAGVNSGSGLAAHFQTGTEILTLRGDALNGYDPGLFDSLKINNDSAASVWIGGGGGNVGIGTAAAGLPVTKLHVDGGNDASLASITSGYFVIGATNAANLVFDNNEFMARNDGAQSTLFINHEGGDVNIGQGGGTCIVRVPVLEITGADVAEKFPTSSARDSVKPGMVMEIDPQNSGKLRIASGAYNRRVAGVVSGAGDIPVGAILGNLPGHEDAPPVALSGRVWVQCDASNGAIELGDLLTTSDTAGHAMKVADYPRAQGAIIGKAMSELKAGETGLVLVLVNLQ